MPTTGIDSDFATSEVFAGALQAAGWNWDRDREDFIAGVAGAFVDYGQFAETAFHDDVFWRHLANRLGGTGQAEQLVAALAPDALTEIQYRLLFNDAYLTYNIAIAAERQQQQDQVVATLWNLPNRWNGEAGTWAEYAEDVVAAVPDLHAAMSGFAEWSHDALVALFTEKGLLQPKRQQAQLTFAPGYEGPEVQRLAEFLDFIEKKQNA
ncbi:hypothetical protein [Lentzea sp. NPDC059081]|uniref:hypothetical protein n=1 Tax=Lentzea sp. NPDC059081 TaxID=3346719 RepID=UPI0036AE305E